MEKWPATEMELAEVVITWLEQFQWDVYQEIQISYGGEIADIVAVQYGIVWVIETKKTFGINLIEQCYKWSEYAHYVSAAIPVRKHDTGFGRMICRKFGIGILEVPEPDGWHFINELQKPKLHRTALAKKIRECLTPEHKTFAKAGNPDGKRLTPFQATCLNVVDEVRKNPGIKLKDLIDNVSHHYSSPATARSCISSWTQEGIIKGIECKRVGKLLKFYPTKENNGRI